MADPVVHITNGVPDSGTGNITTLGQTLVDGADAVKGATTDVAVAAGASGTISGKLRAISRDIGSLVTAWGSTLLDFGSGTGGSRTQRIIVDSSQLAALATTALAMSSGYQLVANPTDQVVPNKAQSQSNAKTSSRVDAAASTNATNLKASAGAIYDIDVFNVASYDVYLKFYNKASAPTVGTDTPIWTIPIKAGTGYCRHFPHGKWFSTGVSYAITKLQADTDTTALVAHDVTGSIDWI